MPAIMNETEIGAQYAPHFSKGACVELPVVLPVHVLKPKRQRTVKELLRLPM